MAHWSDSMRAEKPVQKPLLQEGKTISLHCYSKGTQVPLHFSHETEELLSSQQTTSRQGGFWASPSWERHMGNLWLLKLWPVLAPDSPAHPREPEMQVLLFIPLWFPIRSPVPAWDTCWAGWQQQRQLPCSVERPPLLKYLASSICIWEVIYMRSIWEMIQLKNTTNVLSGNLTDCFRQQTLVYSFLLWPPLETRIFLSPSFNCWWEPPTENNQLLFDRNIN